jgi:hypothetical protein
MGKDLGVDRPVELWQSSLEGRRHHCRICDQPVLGLVGQDQAVTEGMLIQTAGLSPQVDTGWFHTRCVIDAGIGPMLFEMRTCGTGQRRSRSHGGYHAAFHDWLEEVQVSGLTVTLHNVWDEECMIDLELTNTSGSALEISTLGCFNNKSVQPSGKREQQMGVAESVCGSFRKGTALAHTRPRYVTALGATDTSGGWRADKARGGIVAWPLSP